MEKPEFELRVAGDNLAPNTVDVEDLVEILSLLRKALSATTGIPDEPGTEAVLSLVGIKPGSARFQHALPNGIVPSILALCGAIATGNFSPIPSDAQGALARLSTQVVKLGWEIDFITGRGAPIVPARISEGHEIPYPNGGTSRGTTRLYGQLLRVGGVVPAIMIRVRPTDRLVSVQVTPTMAKGLAERLYENIGIECEAFWVRDGWTMTSLKAIRVLPYQQTNLLDAFRELAAVSAGRWDGVDASAYLKELRSEEGEG